MSTTQGENPEQTKTFHVELDPNHPDPVVRFGNRAIRQTVRVLSLLMIVLIAWGILDVGYVFYQKMITPPFYLLEIDDILATFGAFLAVLIAIEIYTNITLYLTENVIHVRLVVATALMAIARKAIVLDYKTVAPEYVIGTAALGLAFGIAYWLTLRRSD